MHFSKTLLMAAALWQGILAQNQLLDRLPSCAVECFDAALPSTACQVEDVGCLCQDQDFQKTTAACYAVNCTIVDSLASTNETYFACDIPIRDQTDILIGVITSLGALALLMVAARLIDRGMSSQAKLGLDDMFIFLSGLSSIPMNAPALGAAILGFGRDMWGITPENITTSFKLLYVTYFFYQIAEFLCQLSILAFYLRIMTDPRQHRIVYVLMGLVVAFGLGNTLAMIFQCWPIRFFWAGWNGEAQGKCTVDIRLFGFIRGGIEIALDLAILSLPLPMLARLQMSRQKKIQVMSMFCVGFIITVVGCLRIWGLVQFGQTNNPTYDNTSGVYWCLTEANLFIVVACMPAMHAIASKLFPRVLRSTSSRYRSTHTPHHNDHKARYWRHGSDSTVGGGKKGASSGGGKFTGGITKSLDVSVYRTERSESDVELVEGEQFRP